MSATLACARLLVLALLATPLAAAAQDAQPASPTTRRIPYTAVLPDGGPDAVAGVRAVTFALFDEAESGAMLWSETQVVGVDARGRFSTHLGSVTPLPLEIFRTEQARWLEVTVDGKALPRTMLVAVPYALRAADAETLGGKPLSEFVLTDGNRRRVRADGTTIDDPAVDGTGVANQLAKWNGSTTLSSSVIAESFDNRIGILAPDPTGGGVVDSRFTIRHLDNNTAIGVLNTSNQPRFALNTLATGGWTMYDGGGQTWTPGLTQWNGKVGIGTASPVTTLDVTSTSAGGGARFTQLTPGNHALRAVTPVGSSAILGMASNFTFDPSGTFSVGVLGFSDDNAGIGVRGQSFQGTGVQGISTSGNAIEGFVLGGGRAGYFDGNVQVTGTLTKGGGSFEIDHPLDPANKYLRHSFVESPDMMNVYNGNVVLDANGEAWITLPDWFEALNRDFRYQLTSIGGPATPYVAAKVHDNRFKIAGGVPGGEVSWQVTGVRHDAFANANRIVVEENKPDDERGTYLHAEAFGQPAAASLSEKQMKQKMGGKPATVPVKK